MRTERIVAAVGGGVAALVLAAVGVTAFRHHLNRTNAEVAYTNSERTINPKLAAAERGLVADLSRGRGGHLLDTWAASDDDDAGRLERFVSRFAGHPTRLVLASPGDDNTANQILAVTCASDHVRQLALYWAWDDTDGGWKVTPDYTRTSSGRYVEYSGCRTR